MLAGAATSRRGLAPACCLARQRFAPALPGNRSHLSGLPGGLRRDRPGGERGETRKMQSGIVVCATPDAVPPFPGWDSIAPCPQRARVFRPHDVRDRLLPADCDALQRDGRGGVPAFARRVRGGGRKGVSSSSWASPSTPPSSARRSKAAAAQDQFAAAAVHHAAVPVPLPLRLQVGGAQGMDVLLRAYFEEFTADEPVSLREAGRSTPTTTLTPRSTRSPSRAAAAQRRRSA